MTNSKRKSPQRIPPWEKGPESEGMTFGTWLRQQREVRQIGLREVAEASKISLRYLEAFERDRFDVLPAEVFSKGFLRQYSAYVGLDPDEVLNYFLWAKQAEDPDAADEAEEENASSPQRPFLMLAVVSLLLIILLAVVLVVSARKRDQGRERPPGLSGPPVSAPAGTQAPPSAASPGAEAPAEGQSGEPNPGTMPGALDPQADSAGVGEARAEGAPEAPATPAAPLQVTLEFSRDCWVEAVIDGGRQRSIRRHFAQGESIEIAAERSVLFEKLGNSGGVQIEVNGEVYPLEGAEGLLLKDVLIDLSVARNLARTSPP